MKNKNKKHQGHIGQEVSGINIWGNYTDIIRTNSFGQELGRGKFFHTNITRFLTSTLILRMFWSFSVFDFAISQVFVPVYVTANTNNV